MFILELWFQKKRGYREHTNIYIRKAEIENERVLVGYFGLRAQGVDAIYCVVTREIIFYYLCSKISTCVCAVPDSQKRDPKEHEETTGADTQLLK